MRSSRDGRVLHTRAVEGLNASSPDACLRGAAEFENGREGDVIVSVTSVRLSVRFSHEQLGDVLGAICEGVSY